LLLYIHLVPSSYGQDPYHYVFHLKRFCTLMQFSLVPLLSGSHLREVWTSLDFLCLYRQHSFGFRGLAVPFAIFGANEAKELRIGLAMEIRMQVGTERHCLL
jgi:hypothetical protein